MTLSRSMQTLQFDTIVIGSGLAGLSAAYHASKHGNVALITKSQLDISNSYYAQGGIAAVMSDSDSEELHVADTLTAGRGLCDLDSVQLLVHEGRERVMELIDMGMSFDRDQNDFFLGLEGGHSQRRILHAGGDATGKELTCFLLKKVLQQPSVKTFEYMTVLSLLTAGNECLGVHALDFQKNENLIIRSKATIIATGGLSRVYDRSTNPHTATGDGIAIAYHAGAELADMEFIQFHPSALYVPGKDAYLISEAVRGEGAWLLNPAGERFMTRIHPLAELAPRDIVALSIYKQMQEHHTSFLHLSLRHLDAKKIKARFSNIYHTLLEYNSDLTTDLIPIAPAAHYMVGGIRTDLNGETNIGGLFACGEVASTGVMGANRLASHSLLECLVFGKRASEKARQRAFSNAPLALPMPVLINTANEAFFLQKKNEIASLMTRNVGIARNKNTLEHAIHSLNAIARELPSQINEYNLLKIKYISDICTLIARSALWREESRGGHFREDFPKERPEFKKHIIQKKNSHPQLTEVRQ